MESLNFSDWGLISYADAFDRQKELFEEAIRLKLSNQSGKNTLVFCEHPPVITVGKSGKMMNLLFPEDVLAEKGVALFMVDRGGDVTFHGPGQLVGYPIFDLDSMGLGLKEYIIRMEEAVILLLASYGIRSGRLEGATGVWLDTGHPQLTRKICAIGVRSSHYVTMHGFALNVNTDLEYFHLINPCGFVDKGVTSLQKELGREVNMQEVKEKLYQIFIELFCK